MDTLTHENIRKLTLDVLNEEDAQAVVDRIVEEEGKIDVLVNNAGALSAGESQQIHMRRVRAELFSCISRSYH